MFLTKVWSSFWVFRRRFKTFWHLIFGVRNIKRMSEDGAMKHLKNCSLSIGGLKQFQYRHQFWNILYIVLIILGNQISPIVFDIDWPIKSIFSMTSFFPQSITFLNQLKANLVNDVILGRDQEFGTLSYWSSTWRPYYTHGLFK